MTTRRNFLKNTTMLAAGLGVSPLLSSSPLRSLSERRGHKWKSKNCRDWSWNGMSRFARSVD